MLNDGFNLLRAYVESPNEFLRDINGDIHAIVAVLEELEKAHCVFLEMLIDAQGPDTFLCFDAETPCDEDIF